jgi:hypothetical protein
MKKLTLLFLLLTVAISSMNAQTATKKPTLLRHVVSLKFKESSSEADVKKVEDAFRGLKSKITQIVDLEWGTNNSPENLNQGFTHCFFLTFKSEKDREDYLVHPDHKVFGSVLGPHLDKVMVIDYWAKD